jgi:hypothetical protein
MYGVSHEGKYCTFNKILVGKAQISVESYLVYQSVSQKSILCDVYFITLNFMIFFHSKLLIFLKDGIKGIQFQALDHEN